MGCSRCKPPSPDKAMSAAVRVRHDVVKDGVVVRSGFTSALAATAYARRIDGEVRPTS